jgi:hypothetical protein
MIQTGKKAVKMEAKYGSTAKLRIMVARKFKSNPMVPII